MKALGAHVHGNFDQIQKRNFILSVFGVMYLTLAVEALTMFFMISNGVGTYDTSITDLILRITTFILSWTQASMTYRFVILLWCVRMRFKRVNDYMRYA